MNIIKQLRTLKKMTQQELSTESKVPLSSIKQYETGKRNPKIEQLKKIADALGVSVDELMGRKPVLNNSVVYHNKDTNTITEDIGWVKPDKPISEEEQILHVIELEKGAYNRNPIKVGFEGSDYKELLQEIYTAIDNKKYSVALKRGNIISTVEKTKEGE